MANPFGDVAGMFGQVKDTAQQAAVASGAGRPQFDDYGRIRGGGGAAHPGFGTNNDSWWRSNQSTSQGQPQQPQYQQPPPQYQPQPQYPPQGYGYQQPQPYMPPPQQYGYGQQPYQPQPYYPPPQQYGGWGQQPYQPQPYYPPPQQYGYGGGYGFQPPPVTPWYANQPPAQPEQPKRPWPARDPRTYPGYKPPEAYTPSTVTSGPLAGERMPE